MYYWTTPIDGVILVTSGNKVRTPISINFIWSYLSFVYYLCLHLWCLLLEGRKQFPLRLHLLSYAIWWLHPNCLSSSSPWISSAHSLTMDVSDGYHYQFSLGHQGYRQWSPMACHWYISVKELWAVFIALCQKTPFHSSLNTVGQHYINRQDSSHFSAFALFKVSKDLILFHWHLIYLTAEDPAGTLNDWVDALSHQAFLLVEGLSSYPSLLTLHCFGLPLIDLFAARKKAQVPIYLSHFVQTWAGVPDWFPENWSLCTTFMLKLVQQLES